MCSVASARVVSVNWATLDCMLGSGCIVYCKVVLETSLFADDRTTAGSRSVITSWRRRTRSRASGLRSVSTAGHRSATSRDWTREKSMSSAWRPSMIRDRASRSSQPNPSSPNIRLVCLLQCVYVVWLVSFDVVDWLMRCGNFHVVVILNYWRNGNESRKSLPTSRKHYITTHSQTPIFSFVSRVDKRYNHQGCKRDLFFRDRDKTETFESLF